MKSKNVIPVICLGIGCVFLIICIFAKYLDIFETYKPLFGILIGIGSGLLGGGFGQLINNNVLDKNPTLKRRKEIEVNDERNIYISNRAKGKAFKAMEYIFPIVILIGVLLEADFLVTIIMVISYLLIYVIYIFYLNKYIKEI